MSVPELLERSVVSPIASVLRTAHGMSTTTTTATAVAARPTRRSAGPDAQNATTGTRTSMTTSPSLRARAASPSSNPTSANQPNPPLRRAWTAVRTAPVTSAMKRLSAISEPSAAIEERRRRDDDCRDDPDPDSGQGTAEVAGQDDGHRAHDSPGDPVAAEAVDPELVDDGEEPGPERGELRGRHRTSERVEEPGVDVADAVGDRPGLERVPGAVGAERRMVAQQQDVDDAHRQCAQRDRDDRAGEAAATHGLVIACAAASTRRPAGASPIRPGRRPRPGR